MNPSSHLPRTLLRLRLACCLLATPLAALAQDNWSTGASDIGEPHASTTNEDQSVFGKVCSSDGSSCRWFIALSTPCVRGAQTPLLLNTPKEAHATTAVCEGTRPFGSQSLHLYHLTDFKYFEDLARLPGIFGVAMPLESGQFRVSRFNTAGAPAALGAMNSPPAAPPRPAGPTGTRGGVL